MKTPQSPQSRETIPSSPSQTFILMFDVNWGQNCSKIRRQTMDFWLNITICTNNGKNVDIGKKSPHLLPRIFFAFKSYRFLCMKRYREQ
jgi:hypothetical protein